MNAAATPDTAPLLQGLPPLVDARTRLLLLGSFPGVASLQAGQYYAHPRNQFWPLLAALLGEDLPALPYPQRVAAIAARGIGLWDVYAHCRRTGSLDSAIRDAAFNDLHGVQRLAPGLVAIGHNGAESARARRFTAALGVAVAVLPSTSPAHAAWSFERKLQAWRIFFHTHDIA